MKFEKSIAIFGGGSLQLSLIGRCRTMGLKTLVLDPDVHAPANKVADAFEVVKGDDFTRTCEVIQKYKVSGLVTTSTDKPLVMMAKVAGNFNLPFISLKTAQNCTDKFKMKQVFLSHNIPCADGKLISEAAEINAFPAIIKPLNNSGSRGVFYCRNIHEAKKYLPACKLFSEQDKILCETFISGEEYSVETIHHDGFHRVIQITKKLISKNPFCVEMGHISPAALSEEMVLRVSEFVQKIASAFNFENCVAHTEIKINDTGIFAIETSPRPGGDFITSILVPLSSGINIEDCLINIALGRRFDVIPINKSCAGVFYLELSAGRISQIDNLDGSKNFPGVLELKFTLKEGENIPVIKNSMDRYGYCIVNQSNMTDLLDVKTRVMHWVNDRIKIKSYA